MQQCLRLPSPSAGTLRHPRALRDPKSSTLTSRRRFVKHSLRIWFPGLGALQQVDTEPPGKIVESGRRCFVLVRDGLLYRRSIRGDRFKLCIPLAGELRRVVLTELSGGTQRPRASSDTSGATRQLALARR
jgi:hypothetical protein